MNFILIIHSFAFQHDVTVTMHDHNDFSFHYSFELPSQNEPCLIVILLFHYFFKLFLLNTKRLQRIIYQFIHLYRKSQLPF